MTSPRKKPTSPFPAPKAAPTKPTEVKGEPEIQSTPGDPSLITTPSSEKLRELAASFADKGLEHRLSHKLLEAQECYTFALRYLDELEVKTESDANNIQSYVTSVSNITRRLAKNFIQQGTIKQSQRAHDEAKLCFEKALQQMERFSDHKQEDAEIVAKASFGIMANQHLAKSISQISFSGLIGNTTATSITYSPHLFRPASEDKPGAHDGEVDLIPSLPNATMK